MSKFKNILIEELILKKYTQIINKIIIIKIHLILTQ